VKLQQSFFSLVVAREVELVELHGRENPVLERVGPDPLISFSDRCRDGLKSQAIGAPGSPRTFASRGLD
jgi:hypothetical protein